MDKKILITGASGFIGKNLQEQLASKYKFLAPSHQKLDLLDTEKVYRYLSKNKPDVVIHSAFIGGARNFNGVNEYLHHKTKESIIKPNMRMLVNLLRGQNFFKRMIIFGSGAEYDKSRDLKKVKESDFNKAIPNDEYGFSKYLCSLMIKNLPKIISLRFFGVYGKYEDYRTRFISNAICKMLLGLPITINQNVYFDYLYVEDLVKIVDYFISHKPKHKFYNVGRGQSIDLITLAKIIKSRGGKKISIKIFKQGLNKEYTCNISRLKKEIPNLQFTGFNKSITKLINYYRSILPAIKKEELDEANKKSH